MLWPAGSRLWLWSAEMIRANEYPAAKSQGSSGSALEALQNDDACDLIRSRKFNILDQRERQIWAQLTNSSAKIDY